MPPVGFEPTIAAGERPYTYGLDRAATEIGIYIFIYLFIYLFTYVCVFKDSGKFFYISVTLQQHQVQ